MCDVKLKEQIYNEFKNGLNPEDVALKLHISGDRRVVYGCWAYYQKKKETEKQKSFIDSEKEYADSLVDRQNECIRNVAKFGRELLNIMKEVGELDVHKKADDYTFVRQVLLHSIENGKQPEDVIDKMQKVSKIRRDYKILDSRLDKISKAKKNLNDLVVAMEYILPSLEHNEENGTELFVFNRTQNADEYRLNLLAAIREWNNNFGLSGINKKI